MKWAKSYVVENGPIFIEFDTYRYHGHSMSDPGITYRTREEIMDIRKNRDPIEIVRAMIIENSFATEKDLKDIEKKIRADIDADVDGTDWESGKEESEVEESEEERCEVEESSSLSSSSLGG